MSNDNSSDPDFDEDRRRARDLIDDEAVTAFHVGVVRDGEEVETTFSFESQSDETEGIQSLTLLATHLRVVADESGVDISTVAGDAVDLAQQVDEIEGHIQD